MIRQLIMEFIILIGYGMLERLTIKLSIGLIFLQLAAAHQFIYRQYWPAFWRVTLVVSVAAFLVSLAGSYLPVV